MLVSEKMLRTSSSTIRTRLPVKIASVSCSRSSIRRFCSGSFASTRCRKSAVSSSSRSGDFTSFTMIVPAMWDLPIIIYTGKDLSAQEETSLRKYAETIIVKDVKSPERLLDETALFLHRVEAKLPEQKRRMLERLHNTDAIFTGKRVLIVDDDVRNIFSLTSMLEDHGMQVSFAENGHDAIALIRERQDFDLVLMDIMMPEMDGYDTTRAIREMPALKSLPIIALTANARKGGRRKTST